MNNLNISKEAFVAVLSKIKAGLENREKFDDALGKFGDGFFCCTIGEEWLSVAIAFLEDAVHDYKDTNYGSTISWWLYEDVEKIIYLPPKTKFNSTNETIELNVESPEDLYDYFLKFH